MKIFPITRSYKVVCDWQKTRNGFKHTADLLRNNSSVLSVKICYLNRTWESFEYQSVLEKLYKQSEDRLTTYEKAKFKKIIKQGDREDLQHMKNVAFAAKVGEIFCDDQKSKNDWKMRMLKAGLESKGLSFPDDWDSLTEDEKERRLNGSLESIY